tara:strand:- start:245 stop:925 length:681 start_codon:yes stop_codon:yes gene_type:complete
MKVVKVYGALAKRLGQTRFEFDVGTPAEAVKALLANFPGLEKWFIDSGQNGIGYRVKLGKETIGEENIRDLSLPWSEKEVFSITPVLSGAITWRQAAPILVGALLITAAIVFAPAAAAGGAGTAGGTAGGAGATGFWGATGTGFLSAGASQALGSIGASLVLTGIGNILSPTPGPLDMKQASNLENFNFSGIVNTAQVGTPIPIAYGRLFVGSTVISSGMDVDQLL